MRFFAYFVAALGLMCFAYITYMNLYLKYSGNDVEILNKLKSNQCILEKKWLTQYIEIHRSSRNVTYQTFSNLPLEKYNAGLDVTFKKRLITTDGNVFSMQVDLDAPYSTFKGVHDFNYHCANGMIQKSKYGFFELVDKNNTNS